MTIVYKWSLITKKETSTSRALRDKRDRNAHERSTKLIFAIRTCPWHTCFENRFPRKWKNFIPRFRSSFPRGIVILSARCHIPGVTIRFLITMSSLNFYPHTYRDYRGNFSRLKIASRFLFPGTVSPAPGTVAGFSNFPTIDFVQRECTECFAD